LGRLTRKLTSLLRNRNGILSLAIGLGLLLGQGAQWTEDLVLLALAFVMVLSTTSMLGSVFRSPQAWRWPSSIRTPPSRQRQKASSCFPTSSS